MYKGKDIMIALNLPTFDYKLQRRGDALYIQDNLRKKYVRLTPEEWVRQHFVHYLINQLGYPPPLMANEAEIQVGKVRKRCDTIVYDRGPRAIALVEYKAPSITLSQRTIEQIVRYNYSCRVPYLILSNGHGHISCHINYQSDRPEVHFMDHIPSYDEISGSTTSNHTHHY